MKYFVTGGTGFIGRRVVDRLVNDGHEVVVATRSPGTATMLPDDVVVVEADITDRETLREPMRGTDGVFHMAAWYFVGPGRENEQLVHRINVEGTKNVLELMRELEIPRGVYTSTVGVVGDVGDGPVDESFRYEKTLPSVYQQTKWLAHYRVAAPMMADGLPLVVVMPGVVYGPGQKDLGTLRAYVLRLLQGTLPFIPRDTRMPYDHVDDAARAHVQAMERGRVGEDYYIGSRATTLESAIRTIASIVGRSPPRTVSPVFFSALASLMDVLERVLTPPAGFQAEALRVFSESNWDLDNAKATRELGLEHRPLEVGLREYVEWERSNLDAEDPMAVTPA